MNVNLPNLPTFKNLGLEEHLRQQFFERLRGRYDMYAYSQFLHGLYHEFPQLNERTRIEYTQDARQIVLAEWLDAPKPPVWMPSPGLLAFLQRLRGGFHTWLVRHERHPGEPQCLYVTYIGYRLVSVGKPSVRQRSIDFKRFGMSFGYPLDFGGGERYPAAYFDLVCAYDGATDTLYIRN